MKVLLVTFEYPPTIGGISTYLKELYTDFPGTVWIVSPHTHKIYTRFFWPHWLPFYFELKKIVALHQPDELHVSHVLPMGRMARWIFKSMGVPYRVIIHGTDLQAAQVSKRKWRAVQIILRDAKSCIVNSEATKKLFLDLCDKEIASPLVISPGVSFPAVSTSSIIEKYQVSGKQIILFVARLVPRKGLTVAVQALQLLLKIPVLGAILVVVGDGPERAVAEKLAVDLGVASQVLFVGAVSEEEKWAWYRAAKLFWFPAQPIAGEWEGFGITSIEAQSVGCPAVVSDLQGLPETVRDGFSGSVVVGTAESFAETSAAILQDPEVWQRMRRAAKENAAAHDWKTQRTLFVQSLK